MAIFKKRDVNRFQICGASRSVLYEAVRQMREMRRLALETGGKAAVACLPPGGPSWYGVRALIGGFTGLSWSSPSRHLLSREKKSSLRAVDEGCRRAEDGNKMESM